MRNTRKGRPGRDLSAWEVIGLPEGRCIESVKPYFQGKREMRKEAFSAEEKKRKNYEEMERGKIIYALRQPARHQGLDSAGTHRGLQQNTEEKRKGKSQKMSLDDQGVPVGPNRNCPLLVVKRGGGKRRGRTGTTFPESYKTKRCSRRGGMTAGRSGQLFGPENIGDKRIEGEHLVP